MSITIKEVYGHFIIEGRVTRDDYKLVKLNHQFSSSEFNEFRTQNSATLHGQFKIPAILLEKGLIEYRKDNILDVFVTKSYKFTRATPDHTMEARSEAINAEIKTDECEAELYAKLDEHIKGINEDIKRLNDDTKTRLMRLAEYEMTFQSDEDSAHIAQIKELQAEQERLALQVKELKEKVRQDRVDEYTNWITTGDCKLPTDVADRLLAEKNLFTDAKIEGVRSNAGRGVIGSRPIERRF